MLGLTQIKVATWLAEKGGKILAYLLVIGLVIGSYVFAYRSGVHSCEQKQAKKEVAAAQLEAKAVVEDAKARAPIVENAATRREQLNNTNKRGLENLDAAIKKTSPRPTCDLTDDELRALNEIGTD